MATQTRALKSILGKRLGLNAYGQIESNGIALTPKCADCSIVVGAENTNVRAITIQLKDANGADLDTVEEVEIGVFLDAGRLAYVVTGGSTGIAIGTDGALQTLVAKKTFLATCEADGDIDLTWTDTGTEVAFLGVKLPTGRWVMSSALTNA
jgi:hypothetical protein